MKTITETSSMYEKVLDIPDLTLLDIANDDSFLLVCSNKNNTHHIYKIDISNLNNWVDLIPGSDRVFSGSLSSDDVEFIYPQELKGNERFNIYLTRLKDNGNKLFLKLDDMRVSNVKRTKDKKFVVIDAGTADKIGLWSYNTQTSKLEEVYSTKLLGEAGSICPNKSLILWSELRQTDSSDYITKLFNFETKELLKLLDLGEGSLITPGSWSPDGSKFLITVDIKGTPKIGVYELDSEMIMYSNASDLHLGVEYPNLEWISNEEIIFTAKLNGETKLYREKLGKQDPQEIQFPKGYIGKIIQGKINKHKFYLSWSSISQPEQIFELNLENNERKLLIDSNPFSIEIQFAKYSFLKYPSFDNKWEIPAFEIAPAMNETKTSPIIVLIHGGPTWEFSNSWESMSNIIHLYSQAGFRVFCPNIRGSTGYGREFQDINIGDLGGDDLKDVLYAKKYLQEKYTNANIYLTGASYGGFMTFLLITKHPGTFKAGAPVVGICDFAEVHRLGDQVFKTFTEHFFKGTPDENKDLYKDRSAINFIDNLQEPLYIVHRENDSRCPVLPIYTFVGKAAALGKNVTLFVQRDAGHGSQKREDLKQQYGGIVKFFLQQEENN